MQEIVFSVCYNYPIVLALLPSLKLIDRLSLAILHMRERPPPKMFEKEMTTLIFQNVYITLFKKPYGLLSLKYR